MRGVRKHLIKHTERQGLTYVAELSAGGQSLPKMDHLVRAAAAAAVCVCVCVCVCMCVCCVWGKGMLGLGLSPGRQSLPKMNHLVYERRGAGEGVCVCVCVCGGGGGGALGRRLGGQGLE